MAHIQVKQDWEAVKTDPVEFARMLIKRPGGIPFEPFEAQQQILRGIKRCTVIDTGRQFGQTTTLGVFIANKAVTNANWNLGIIAPSLELSRIIHRGSEGCGQLTRRSHLDRTDMWRAGHRRFGSRHHRRHGPIVVTFLAVVGCASPARRRARHLLAVNYTCRR
jgi:hypothetical protein